MDLRVLQPKQNDYPSVEKDTLRFGKTVRVAFNRRGALLAAGLHDGRIVIWDFQTKGVAKVLKQHTKPISNIKWSRNGRKLLTGCNAGELCMWHVAEGTLDYRFVEASKKPIVHASLCPRNSRICCATPKGSQPYLITVLENKRVVLKRLQLVVRQKKATKVKSEFNVLSVFSWDGK
eukprot:UN24849